MTFKDFLGIGLRIVTIFYILFALLYGIVFVSVDLSGTIPFKDAAEAAATRQVQLCVCIPYIILGVMLTALLVLFYVSRHSARNFTRLTWYGVFVIVIGALLALGMVIDSIYIKEFSLIVCNIPAFCITLYGIFLLSHRENDLVGKSSVE